jgi:hypothetical protein
MSVRQTKYCSALLLVALVVACRSRGTLNPGPTLVPGRDISPDGVWERLVNETIVFNGSVVKVTPRSYTAFRLKATALDDMLRRAPLEFTSSGQNPTVMSLPQPDGSFGRFQIEESPIMEPELAKRFPMIKTYRARGLDDRTATGRFEQTRHGLHAMILSAAGDFLVDAVGKNDANVYVSYFKKDLPPDPDEFACLEPKKPGSAKSDKFRQHAELSTPGLLRTYRLAVAASYAYVEAIHSLNNPNAPSSDPLEEALEAINRTVDRINSIYERDVGIHLNLINDEPKIIHTDAATNPYHEADTDDHLRILNQDQMTQVIKPENYDVGQLFIAPAKAYGGSAQPCACSPVYKAYGLVGSPHPTGNEFDVQYAAHEIAHQFGASHSFNGTTLGCVYRNAATAYEPGSGSTIMGYSTATAICGDETIQSTPDPYFHAISLKEIRAFITNTGNGGGDLCAQKLQTGNRFAPEVDGGPDYTIPGNTPFALTVRSSRDGDGDALTFTWEEFDLGSPDPPQPGNPNEHRKKRPLFRSREGSPNLTRIFPALEFCMNAPAVYVAESKPTNNRDMTFRVTARDGRGLFSFDDVTVTVVSKRGSADVGPFEVRTPGAGVVWPRGSTQTVTWSVARTNRVPINCARVRISLLIRDDPNNPIILADDALNNGSAQIMLPNDLPLTTTARIKVEAIGNIFFNVSQADIQIIAASAPS